MRRRRKVQLALFSVFSVCSGPWINHVWCSLIKSSQQSCYHRKCSLIAVFFLTLNKERWEMRGVRGDGTKSPGVPVVCQAPDQGQPTRICSRKEFTGAHRNHKRVEVKPERSRREVPRALPRLTLMVGTNTSWWLFFLVICPPTPTHSALIASGKQWSVLLGRQKIGHWWKLNRKDVRVPCWSLEEAGTLPYGCHLRCDWLSSISERTVWERVKKGRVTAPVCLQHPLCAAGTLYATSC